MKTTGSRLLFWTPRILGVLFALFVSLFAFDVFAPGADLGEMILAFIIHLVPTAMVVIALALAWRWEWIGTLVFVGLGLLYIIEAWGQFVWVTYALISGPLFLIGALFLANWLYRRKASPGI